MKLYFSVSEDEGKIIYSVYIDTESRGYAISHDILRNRQGKNICKNQKIGALYNSVTIFPGFK